MSDNESIWLADTGKLRSKTNLSPPPARAERAAQIGDPCHWCGKPLELEAEGVFGYHANCEDVTRAHASYLIARETAPPPARAEGAACPSARTREKAIAFVDEYLTSDDYLDSRHRTDGTAIVTAMLAAGFRLLDDETQVAVSRETASRADVWYEFIPEEYWSDEDVRAFYDLRAALHQRVRAGDVIEDQLEVYGEPDAEV